MCGGEAYGLGVAHVQVKKLSSVHLPGWGLLRTKPHPSSPVDPNKAVSTADMMRLTDE
jgi:hypothetical protein